ncbi:MAG: homoserine dehydrogenase, partial [Candidatus Peregrinibacteria bacterium]|nr:homoserine dehydrogenase [Candidatus Peregrinibacteria bacterium]
TNFILSKMETEGAAYDDVLREAQELGFAEADPTADVGGFDAQAKLSILINEAFGAEIPEDEIATNGITEVSDVDFKYAKSLNSTIKLLAVAEAKEGKLTAFVSPVLVSNENQLAKVGGATNAISIQSEYLGETTLVGQGAGRFPTANAVVSDILAISNNKIDQPFSKENPSVEKVDDFSSQFYVRFKIKDGTGIVETIGRVCKEQGISIHSISQLPIGDPENLPFILTTEIASQSSVQKMCSKLSKEDFCIEKPFFIPILK